MFLRCTILTDVIIKLIVSLFFLFPCAISLYAQFDLEQAFPNLTFVRPVDLQHPGDGSNKLFVIEQRGIVLGFENSMNASASFNFLDISNRVNDSGNEEGLLGLAFHPNYAANGFFYVNYTASNPNSTVIARYSVNPDDGTAALNDSEFIILEVSQPFPNHNGGQLAFGPDGYLYIGLGDGGSGGDPLGNGQNKSTLLGAMLRIDVDSQSPDNNYRIPPDNPFAGNTSGFKEEIYAYGLRNPWRFSFDSVTGNLWVADVGQNSIEEIDIVESGVNYGWNITEGSSCFNPPSGCSITGLQTPVWEYDHSLGASVTGGYVYRGTLVPELKGKYIYTDFVSGRIWSLEYDGVNPPVNTQLIDSDLSIASLGVGRDNELYFLAFDGKIYRIQPTILTSVNNNPVIIREYFIGQNYPNPFNPETTIQFSLPKTIHVSLRIYNTRGQEIINLIDTVIPAGRNEAVWDGKNNEGQMVSSGIYFMRLQAGRFTDFKRMTFIK